MSKVYKIGNKPLSLSDIATILSENMNIKLSKKSEEKVLRCRTYLDSKMSDTDSPIYGINTGFGSLYNHPITNNDLESIQRNLVLSHACGTGSEVPQDIVKIMLLLKIQSLSYGYSAIHIQTIERLIDMFNNNILPVIYEQGSLGASGDLAPLAHLSLPLIGKGEVDIPGVYENGYFKRRKSSNPSEFMKED